MKTHIIALIFALSANAAANIMIKAGMHSKDVDLADPAGALRSVVFNPLVVGGIVLFALNILSYAYVLTRVPLSTAYPIMTSGGFLIVLTASAIYLKESLAPVQYVGIVLIIAGVVLVASRME